MRPAFVLEILTPKKFLLNGLWFGPLKPKKMIIWVHGLSSSAFSRHGLIEKIIDDETAVMTFNNRGHDTVTRISRINARKKGGYDRVLAGAAHEKFTECVDDIQGAVNFAKKHGAKEIYLAGHSTGCQKSVYYATRKGNASQVDGVILLAPISDYASETHFDKKAKRLKRAERDARALIKKGKDATIVPGWWLDAQRFLSLYTPDSAEEIFTYIDPKKKPRTYAALTVPTLVFLAEKDEYNDRLATKLAEWFAEHSRADRFELDICKGATHAFKEAEAEVATRIRRWISGSRKG
jgi:alpha-beta hydrolase superfamily lysophospholipase